MVSDICLNIFQSIFQSVSIMCISIIFLGLIAIQSIAFINKI